MTIPTAIRSPSSTSCVYGGATGSRSRPRRRTRGRRRTGCEARAVNSRASGDASTVVVGCWSPGPPRAVEEAFCGAEGIEAGGPRPRASSRRSRRPVLGGVQAGSQAVGEDRPDLRLARARAGPACRSPPGRARDAGPATPAAPGSRRRVVAVVSEHLGLLRPRPLGAAGIGRRAAVRAQFAHGPRPAVRSRRAHAPTATSIARSCDAVRCAPGRSPLFTTTMSATSSRPALIAWTSSPISGASRTTVVSAAAATSTSDWPVPTVSSRIRSKPGRVHDGRGGGRCRGQPTGVAARSHRSDEDVAVARVRLHPDAIAEQRAAGDRAGRVDRHHGDRAAHVRGRRRSAPRRASTCPSPADR